MLCIFKYIPRVVDIFKTHNHNEVIKCILNFNDFPLSLNGVGLFIWSIGFSFFFLYCVLLFFYFFYSLVVFLIHIKGSNRLYGVLDFFCFCFSVLFFIIFLFFRIDFGFQCCTNNFLNYTVKRVCLQFFLFDFSSFLL